ncbi:MRK1-like protein [Saccharomyces kudriavzevii IFO 1802]|uniref:non-specific serine/threonine protein kinase n=1 Tax=Saccharomyces kudriavzevii (strain ATCC MYA-4449 / AS 2.2408 / CBS 8840 / NBRC 1802 / NCYC 2889) TaxID=226230 RepID=J4TY80_SACK1|nr:MRK1-like protein [Saccharomyces kudriavzevii IFO 1802]
MDIQAYTNIALVHKKVYKHEHAGNADADKKNSEEAVNISYPTAEVVGHGSFGVVVTTVINETNQKVAIKKVLQDKRYKNRELETMKMLNHANTIGLQYYFYERDEEDEVYLNLVLDYMPQSLYQRLRHFIHLKTKMDRLEIKFYAYQLFRALNYLHNVPQICHRDIKPQNLLVDPKTFSFKICDFGSAKCLKPDQPNVSYICSRYYRAPELMFGATDYSNQIDVWSSACVITELLLGKPLFSGESGIDQLVEVIKIMGIPTKDEISGMNPNYEDHIFPNIKPITLARVLKAEDPDVLELLSKTLRYHPRERLAPLQCLFLGYFDEIKCCGTDAYAKAQRLRIFDFDVQTELGHMPPAELPAIEANLKHPVSKASTSS